VSEEVGSATLLLVGALLVRLSLTGAYERYVRAGMGAWLLVAGVLLAALGLVGVVRAILGRGAGTAAGAAHAAPDGAAHAASDGAGHAGGHQHRDRVGWLLLAPVLALLLVTPPALGSFGVDRSTVVTVSSGGRTFRALPPGAPVPMTLLEFDQRAADHDGASFGTTPVRLTGFVARTADGAGFRIARYQIACCAADAVAAVVRVVGAAGTPPARDDWVTVTGTFHGSPGGVPEVLASGLTAVPAPVDPYE
jgi:uncharacterized repeat protein (TIGR03943 family)